MLRRRPLFAAPVLAVALAAACSGGGSGGSPSDGAASGPSTTRAATTTTVAPLAVQVAPGADAVDVALNAGVKVTATSGTLEHVAVVPLTPPPEAEDASVDGEAAAEAGTTPVAAAAAAGGELPGTLSQDGRSWSTTWPMSPATTYRVTATGADGSTPAPTTFTTLTPVDELHTRLNVFEGSTYGVGMPVVAYLTKEVPEDKRAAVEERLHLTTEPALTGDWHWFANDELHWRPALYWPAGTKAKLKVDFKGLDVGGGVWGVDGREVNFAIGDAHHSLVDAATHTMTVRSNGQVVRTIPVSTGRDEFPTKSGIHVVSEAEKVHVMDSSTIGIPSGGPGGYRETVNWAVRISNSGEFVHSAPWSTGSQGNENVSHGCVNVSDADGEWFYGFTQYGDVVEVINTPETLQPGNGYSDWQMPWSEWTA